MGSCRHRAFRLWTTFLLVGCAHGEEQGGVWVHDLAFEGNNAIATGVLREKLATTRTGWWPFAPKRWYDAAALDLDLKRVSALYADRGYFDARVADHRVTPRTPDSVDITIVVEEGKPTRITSLALRGFPGSEETSRLQKRAQTLGVKPGAIVDYESYGELKAAAQDRLKEAGYAYGKVTGDIAIERDRHTAVITLAADRGPLVRLGHTSIEGSGGLPAWKLQHRVTWNEGDRYDPGDIATTQGRLYDLGVFSSVRIELPPEPTERADVAIKVRPGKLRELRLGGGAGLDRQRQEVRLLGVWTFSNFFGGLRKLRLRLKPAYVAIPGIFQVERRGPAAEADAQLTQPDLFGSEVYLRGTAGYDLTITEGYQAHGPRAQLGIDRPFWRSRVQAGIAWNLQYLRFFDIVTEVFDPETTSLGFGFQNPYRLAYLEEFAQLDLRDHPLDPRYGGYLSVRLEQGSPYLGGAFRYTKVTPELRLYAPVGRRIVLAARGLGGWLRPLGSGRGAESPITRRFQLGGPSSHRGFSFGRLSPQEADSNGQLIPVGGDGEVLFSFDARIDVMKLGDHWLGLVPFVDAGDVTVAFGDLSLRRLHWATGLSVEYQTPIGVVRGGAGFRLNRWQGTVTPGLSPANPDPGERLAIHITIGEAF
jgi:outer membrane protein assembly factor BamA